MTKKTINISEKIIHSIILGFLFSIIIVIAGHFIQDDWTSMPDSRSPHYGTYGASVSWCSYECIFGERHSADCTGKTLSDYDESKPKILSSSFEHISLIVILGLIISIIIYIFKTVSLKVVKE